MNINETSFANGFAFYKSRGNYTEALAQRCLDNSEWIKGFCCALADYDLEGEYKSIEQALLACGVEDVLLSELIQTAEHVLNNTTEFMRWPNVPIRTYKAPSVSEILNEPSTSFWLKNAIRTSFERDPVDAVRDVTILATVLTERCNKILNDDL